MEAFTLRQEHQALSKLMQVGMGTNVGICSWISPFYSMPSKGKETVLRSLPAGALSGENNGLSILLDAETFDYGNGFSGQAFGEQAGEGFKVGAVHPLDMPNVQQSGVNVMPGEDPPCHHTSTPCLQAPWCSWPCPPP